VVKNVVIFIRKQSRKRELRKPDFFIVGAPKSGTTSMLRHLDAHPGISMPQSGEPLYFASDLDWPMLKISDLDHYLQIFSMVSNAKRVGEKSVWYLYSTMAAREIKSFNPDSQIIIMLRNPIDMIYSYHGQMLRQLDEDIANFENALDAEEDRKRGKRIPETSRMPEALYYTQIVKYSVQVERFLSEFGPERVHIVILDDFEKNPAETYRGILNFLDVNCDFQPDFKKHNLAIKLRSRFLERLLLQEDPPAYARMLPSSIWPALHWRLKKFNRIEVSPPRMRAQTRAQLKSVLASDIERLGDILGRDLAFWSR
jgi:hypothetical protein